MASKKFEQTDLFAPPAPPPPAPAQVTAPAPSPPPPEPPGELPTLELLDLTGDGVITIPAVQQKGYAAPQQPERAYRVAELLKQVARTLDARYAEVFVEGEISNLKTPGHCYFTLKDADAQLPAVMFRTAALRLKFRLADGQKVRARGRLSIYEPQGKLQLYVESLEPVGLGALQLAFEQLKKKLGAEGLFDEARKRKLPFLPRRIGIATSATGAAVRDIVRVATRRGPVSILIAPCLVQGDAAPADIVRALRSLERHPDIDLIIVGRGGGSVEDLWAFNSEAVARAIAGCRVPVISAVGHEVDFTIADFVADRRAATPSQAAELAVPMHAELVHRVDDLTLRLHRTGRRAVADSRQRLDGELGRARMLLQRSIDGGRRALTQAAERLATLHPRARLARDRAVLVELERRLQRPLPDRIGRGERARAGLRARLDTAMQHELSRHRRGFAGALGKLDALSPLKVLERGYGLVRGPAGEVVTSAAQLKTGAAVTVRLARGSFGARVETVSDGSGSGSGGGSGSGSGE